MPKVTYPRPCPTCGKEFKHGFSFFYHKQQCGTTEHRHHCPYCSLTFNYKCNLKRHVQQQHSKTPPTFTCPKCHDVFNSKQGMKEHLETVCADVKPSFRCWYCSASFRWQRTRQRHMRRVHGRVCRAQDINLLLHLQHLSEEKDCQNEWIFVESHPIHPDEPRICHCGQNNIQHYFFLENKFNGNRTFVGSTCIKNIDPRVGKVVGYFQYILRHPIQGTYVGDDSHGLQMFTVASNTQLVEGAEDVVKHLKPQVFKTEEGTFQVWVNYPQPATLVPGQSYDLRLKAQYVRGQLTFTVV